MNKYLNWFNQSQKFGGGATWQTNNNFWANHLTGSFYVIVEKQELKWLNEGIKCIYFYKDQRQNNCLEIERELQL